MKKLRSILALLMVAAMVLSFGIVAMAADAEEEVEPAAELVLEGDPDPSWPEVGIYHATTSFGPMDLKVYEKPDKTLVYYTGPTENVITLPDDNFVPGDNYVPASETVPEDDGTPKDSTPTQEHQWDEYTVFKDLGDVDANGNAKEYTREELAAKGGIITDQNDPNYNLPNCKVIKGDADGAYIGIITNAETGGGESGANQTTKTFYLQHKPGAETTKAKCSDPGPVEYTTKCTICGKVIKTRMGDPPAHKWSSQIPNNTLWGKVTEETKPTCEKEGYAIDYCTVCGKEDPNHTRPLQKTDHVMEVEWVKPICQRVVEDTGSVTVFTTGSMLLKCSVCGYVPDTLGATAADEADAEAGDDAGEAGEAEAGEDGEEEAEESKQYFTYKNELGLDRETTIVIPDEAEADANGRYKNNGSIPVTLAYYQENVDETYDGHKWTDFNVTKKATCESDGIMYRQCVRCGMDQRITIPALGHTPVVEFTQQIDCFSAIDVYKCSTCKETLFGYFEDVDEDGDGKADATVFVRVYKGKSLKDVLAAFKAGEEDALKIAYESSAHEYDFNDLKTIDVDASVKATNEKNGTNLTKEDLFEFRGPSISRIKTPSCDGQSIIVVYKCKYCAQDYVYTPGKTEADHPTFEKEIAPAKHTWGAWKLENQSTYQDGTVWYHWVRVCKVCGLVDDKNLTFDPNQYDIHSPSECKMQYAQILSEDAPSCVVGGKVTKFCPICGKTEEVVIDPIGEHSWNEGEPIKVATCANGGETGRTLYTCTVCGELEVRIEPAPKHVWITDPAVAPEIGKPGKEAGRHCAVCGTTEGGAEIPALEKNTYETDASGIKVDDTTVGGTGKIEKTGGNMAEEQLYARIVISFKRADETTYSIAVVVPVIDYEFDAPVVEGGIDPITSVTVIICNTKNVTAEYAANQVVPATSVAF